MVADVVVSVALLPVSSRVVQVLRHWGLLAQVRTLVSLLVEMQGRYWMS